jgi:hypothetical protein
MFEPSLTAFLHRAESVQQFGRRKFQLAAAVDRASLRPALRNQFKVGELQLESYRPASRTYRSKNP